MISDVNVRVHQNMNKMDQTELIDKVIQYFL